MQLQVFVHDTDFSEFCRFRDTRISKELTQYISVAELTFIDGTGLAAECDFAELDEVILEDSVLGTKVFAGTIATIQQDWLGKGKRLLKISCQDWMAQLDSVTVTQTWTGQTDRAIIQELIADHFPTFTALTANVGQFVSIDYEAKDESVRSIIQKIAGMASAEFRIDPDKNLYYFRPSEVTNPAPFGLSTEWDGVTTFQYDRNVTYQRHFPQPANHVTFLGGLNALTGTEIVEVAEDTASQTEYGLRAVTIVDRDVVDPVLAGLRANAELEARAWPQESGTVRFRRDGEYAGLEVGQTIYIKSSEFGFEDQYTVRRLNLSWVTQTKIQYEIEFGDYNPDLVRILQLLQDRTTEGTILATSVPAEIPDGSITSAKLADGAVTNLKIAAEAVTEAKIALGSITNSVIALGTILATNIADNAVTTPKLNANAVTSSKIGAGEVIAGKLAAGAVIAGNIAAGSITAAQGVFAVGAIQSVDIGSAQITQAKIGNLAVGNAQLDNLSISNGKIQDSSITNAKIGNSEITGAKIANATITSTNIANAAIDNARIADASISSAKIQSLAVISAKINDLAVDSFKLAGLAVTRSKIENLAVDGFKVDNLALTTGHIQNGSITNPLVATNAIGTSNILNGAVDGFKVQSLALTTGHIQNGSITNALIANLAVDNAKISNMAVSKLQTGTLSVAGTGAGIEVAYSFDNRKARIYPGEVSIVDPGGSVIFSASGSNFLVSNNAVFNGYVSAGTGFRSNGIAVIDGAQNASFQVLTINSQIRFSNLIASGSPTLPAVYKVPVYNIFGSFVGSIFIYP